MRPYLFAAFRAIGREPDEIEAEARIERICERRELFAEQSRDDCRIARGTGRRNYDVAHFAIGAEESGFELARAFAAF